MTARSHTRTRRTKKRRARRTALKALRREYRARRIDADTYAIRRALVQEQEPRP